MANEKTLWEKLRTHLGEFGDLQRVENGLGAGTPDVNFCIQGGEGWIELKHGEMPARPETPVFKSQRGLDPQQIAWILNRCRHGGCALIFAQVGEWLFLVHGQWAGQFNTWTVDEMVARSLWFRRKRVENGGWSLLADQIRRTALDRETRPVNKVLAPWSMPSS
jgi:hypothetical protein